MTPPGTTLSAADPALHEQVGDAPSILLSVPELEPHGTEGCLDLLTIDDPSNIEVMCMSFTDAPDDWLDQWQTHVGTLPGKTWFITTDEYARSTASQTTASITTPDDSIRIDTISNPGNLTRVGVVLTDQLKAYRQSASDRQLVVCLQSLGTLLQYADVQQVFRFLHTLSGQIENTDAFAHYHLDPVAHDAQTIHTLRTLFDAVITYEDPDGWTVQTRS